MSREITTEEIREQFIRHLHHLVDYWANLPEDCREGRDPASWRIDGVVFSVLSALDGCTMGFPGFIVAPIPHVDAKEYNISEGNDYYPENSSIDVKGDIGGALHEYFSMSNQEEKNK